MDNVIKKTNLGIAVQEAIGQLGLERQKGKIMSCLQRAFEEKYQQFKKSMNSTTVNFKGYYVVDNEFPIGQRDKQQHFRCIVYDGKIQGSLLKISTGGERRPFTLIESFSKNEENKKRPHAKLPSKMDKKLGSGGRKAVKK